MSKTKKKDARFPLWMYEEIDSLDCGKFSKNLFKVIEAGLREIKGSEYIEEAKKQAS